MQHHLNVNKDVSTGLLVAQTVLGTTNNFLIGFKACSTEGNSLPDSVNLDKNLWSGREATAILSNEHDVHIKLLFKHLCL